MELLLCIVEANAAAKALAGVAGQSLHAVDDCSCIVECCTNVLPAALSALEGAATTSEDVIRQAVVCVQECKMALIQLRGALESLHAHDSEGALGILLQHPAAWLDTYRGFRVLLAQLLGIRCFVRAAAQRGRADDAEAALQNSIRALTATCGRAREAANLLGSELPLFARAATADGWSSGRVRLALTASQNRTTVGAASPCRRFGYRQDVCSCGSSGGSAAAESPNAVLAAADAALQQQQPAQQHQQQQRLSLLQRIGKAAVCSSPGRANKARRGSGGSASPDRSYAAGAAADVRSKSAAIAAGGGLSDLDDVACTLVSRIQDLILYDSEIDQLEQDRAYLQQNVSHLREFCCTGSGGGTATAAMAKSSVDLSSPAAAPAKEPSAAAAAATASLIQSEVLLAAVDSRLKALESDGDASGEPLRTGGAAALQYTGRGDSACTQTAVGGGGGGGVSTRRRASTRSDRLIDPEDLYDDVRKRPPGLRWLPVCFVGA